MDKNFIVVSASRDLVVLYSAKQGQQARERLIGMISAGSGVWGAGLVVWPRGLGGILARSVRAPQRREL